MENVVVYTVEVGTPTGKEYELVQATTPETRNVNIPGFRYPVPREHHKIIKRKLDERFGDQGGWTYYKVR